MQCNRKVQKISVIQPLGGGILTSSDTILRKFKGDIRSIMVGYPLSFLSLVKV